MRWGINETKKNAVCHEYIIKVIYGAFFREKAIWDLKTFKKLKAHYYKMMILGELFWTAFETNLCSLFRKCQYFQQLMILTYLLLVVL